jgi:hypothetical protein
MYLLSVPSMMLSMRSINSLTVDTPSMDVSAASFVDQSRVFYLSRILSCTATTTVMTVRIESIDRMTNDSININNDLH